ncbi:MAG TPA: phosphoethanolamine--lipid A transferase, partial [Ramlibacter sp.]
MRPGLALRWRPELSVEALVLCSALFMLAAGNGRFWQAALAQRPWAEPATWGFSAAVFVALSALYVLAGATVATRHTVKPLLTVLLLTSAAVACYSDRYAVYFDRAMLRNILATDVHEAGELLGWPLALYMLALGVLPSLLVWWPRLKRRTLGRAVALRLAWLAAAAAVAAGSLVPVFADFASLMRNHKEVRYLLTPGNVVAALAGYAWGSGQRASGPRLPVGPDAKFNAASQQRPRPTLFVLVVGETARAQNFALNGYSRPTNPDLARRPVINFPQVTACGTSTEVSLPCMFSPWGRGRYDEGRILSHESLLHVLARAGFQVQWRDNQSGCKGVCSGLAQQQLNGAAAAASCAGGQCPDEVLLQGLEGAARDERGNLFIVLHQLGSHGPAYYRRYPAAYRRFAPACETEDLRSCTREEIVNAYDNSLLYTDHVLGALIDILERAQPTHDTAMLYVSDHGESLGESGLYLHGVPYPIAPDVQTRVPMVMWLSPAFRRSHDIDEACLRRRAAQPA